MSTATPPSALRGAHVNHQLRGGHGRLGRRMLWFFGGGFALLIGLGALGSGAAAPSAPRLCPSSRPCGPPPVQPPAINETVWRSSQYGFTLEYPSGIVRVSQSGPSYLTLNAGNGIILIQAVPTASGSLTRAISRQVGGLNAVGQVALDTNPADQLLGGGVGYRPGVGQVFTGFLNAPQGASQRLALASEAATDGRITISATVVGASGAIGPQARLAALGDDIINSVRWAGGR